MNRKIKLFMMCFLILAMTFSASSCASYPYRLNLMRNPGVISETDTDPFIDIHKAEQGTDVDVFYATSREPSSKKDIEPFYTNRRDNVLRLGLATVQFGDKNVTWEELKEQSLLEHRQKKYPLEVIKIEEFGVLNTSLSVLNPDRNTPEAKKPAEEFIIDINKKLDETKSKNIYIFVGGVRVNFENPVLVAAELWHYMGYRGVFFAFPWPATPGAIFSYSTDLETAIYSSRDLRLLLEFLASETKVEKINIIAYSAGTRVVASALKDMRLKYLADDRSALRKRLKIGQVALISGDLNKDDFGAFFDDGFHEIPETMTLYMSRIDAVLGFATWILRYQRLGNLTEEKLLPEVSEYLRTHDDLVAIDVTNAKYSRSENGHGYFINSPWVSSDILLSMTLNIPPGERGLVRKEGKGIWTFPPSYIKRLQIETENNNR
ncbi:MAG: alpha/beta hydrolase [Candidatus Omnitrophota bacterium]